INISLLVILRTPRLTSYPISPYTTLFLSMIVKGLASTRHPVDAHIIPIRRCNLSCTYCNEFDSFSKPVRTQEMLKRVDKLAALRSEEQTSELQSPDHLVCRLLLVTKIL